MTSHEDIKYRINQCIFSSFSTCSNLSSLLLVINNQKATTRLTWIMQRPLPSCILPWYEQQKWANLTTDIIQVTTCLLQNEKLLPNFNMMLTLFFWELDTIFIYLTFKRFLLVIFIALINNDLIWNIYKQRVEINIYTAIDNINTTVKSLPMAISIYQLQLSLAYSLIRTRVWEPNMIIYR